jgi:hypothetical protein
MKSGRERKRGGESELRIIDRKKEKRTEVLWIRCKKTARISTIQNKYDGKVLASESVKTFYAGGRIPKGRGSKIVTLRRPRKRKR